MLQDDPSVYLCILGRFVFGVFYLYLRRKGITSWGRKNFDMLKVKNRYGWYFQKVLTINFPKPPLTTGAFGLSSRVRFLGGNPKHVKSSILFSHFRLTSWHVKTDLCPSEMHWWLLGGSPYCLLPATFNHLKPLSNWIFQQDLGWSDLIYIEW